ncbi:F pilus assembly Type-IV secretion system for plasmid transfer family protein [Escherichia coli]|nr:F pilus assembly Type-IV secretion system for plasmid transfer family protein [Escherichia coli]
MNNPLEAVTQAVNSLVTALKLPDESAKANEVLGEMSFPQFSRLLPYRDYNQESGLFMNDTTMGFMLEAIPINGANESIVEALDHMLRTKLPRGIPLCIHLMSSQLVGDRIEYGLREFSWSGEQAERFNAITRAYYMKAAATQFPLPEGMNLPLTLRHYRVFISYCSPSKKKSRADILEMENLVKIIRASLQGASITTQTVDAQAFIDIVGEMINHNPDSLYPAVKLSLKYQARPKVAPEFIPRDINPEMENRLSAVLAAREAEGRQMASLFKPDVPEVVSGEDVTQAEQPQQPVSPAINDKKSDSGVNVPAGGIEQELKMKPEEEMEQQLPPGISESGEVVDMAAYEAWQQENHPDIQQQMQRREEVNINVHRERGEDVEPGDDF